MQGSLGTDYMQPQGPNNNGQSLTARLTQLTTIIFNSCQLLLGVNGQFSRFTHAPLSYTTPINLILCFLTCKNTQTKQYIIVSVMHFVSALHYNVWALPVHSWQRRLLKRTLPLVAKIGNNTNFSLKITLLVPVCIKLEHR